MPVNGSSAHSGVDLSWIVIRWGPHSNVVTTTISEPNNHYCEKFGQRLWSDCLPRHDEGSSVPQAAELSSHSLLKYRASKTDKRLKTLVNGKDTFTYISAKNGTNSPSGKQKYLL